ncbi:hypothetical protein DSM112329_03933 [Paraconexibacter sp. AEG42_29]|uniref:J domain-containing protein n=1 Tax=Paraconexibacter sp. AEG42_29 TaxID=2997339 RepID=A0AAU7B0F2_9ACTN
MDPHAVLGLPADASIEEATAAYRALAKAHHPDVAGDPRSAEVMARINAAFDELRDRAGTAGSVESAAGEQHGGGSDAAAAPGRPPRGDWLPEATRRALGHELLAALERQEQVALVVPVATWASPEALLALTDRRLLWLADDQPTHRVRSLRFRDVQRVESKLAWPRRRKTASVRVRTKAGRRLDFGDLEPEVALRITQAVGGTL